MGARNVSNALAMYPELGHRAMRLLLGMSLTALDYPTQMHPSQRYFGGRDALAEILGYRLPPAPTKGEPPESDEARKRRATAYEIVRQSLAELIKANAVTRTTTGGGIYRSEYALRVAALPVDNEPAQTQ